MRQDAQQHAQNSAVNNVLSPTPSAPESKRSGIAMPLRGHHRPVKTGDESMSHENYDAPEVEEKNDNQAQPEKPLLYFQTLGRRYKRKNPYPKPRPYDRAKEKGEYGPPEEMQAVFDSRAAYRREHPHPENHGEIGTDTRDLALVLADFPGLHDFVMEVETYRRQAVDRLEIIKELRRELVKASGPDAALKTQLVLDRAHEEETGLVSVAMLRREFRYENNQGVTRHIRTLSKEKDEGGNWKIKDSSARWFDREETAIIRERLRFKARAKKGSTLKAVP